MKVSYLDHYGKTSEIGIPLFEDEEVVFEKFSIIQGDPMEGGPCMTYFLRTKRGAEFFTYYSSGTLDFTQMLYRMVSGSLAPLDEDSDWCKHLVKHYVK